MSKHHALMVYRKCKGKELQASTSGEKIWPVQSQMGLYILSSNKKFRLRNYVNLVNPRGCLGTDWLTPEATDGVEG